MLICTGFEHVLTVDGATGTGKTGLLRQLAARYPVAAIELGPVVRAVSWVSRRHGITVPDAVAVLARLEGEGRIAIDRPGADSLAASDVELDGIRLGAEMFSSDLAATTAAASVDPEAMAWIHGFVAATLRGRAAVVSARQAARSVCPAAGFRIRLEADARVRAARKCAQLRALGLRPAFVDDSHLMSPLDEVDAALDTTHLDADQVATQVFALVERQLGWRPRVDECSSRAVWIRHYAWTPLSFGGVLATENVGAIEIRRSRGAPTPASV